MNSELKRDLVEVMKHNGAYDVRIADPHVGFEHSPEGRHPLQLWPECNSVICFAVARPRSVAGLGFGLRRPEAVAPGFRDRLYLGEEEESFYRGWDSNGTKSVDLLSKLFPKVGEERVVFSYQIFYQHRNNTFHMG